MSMTLEERVAYLEGKVEEHSKGLEDIKDLIIALDQKLDRRIDALDQKMDRRIDALDQKIDSRVDALDQKIDSRVDALDKKLSKYFLWIIGIQITIFLSIIATLLR